MKWRFFIGASILVGYGLAVAGVPLAAVAAGIALAAVYNYVQQKRSPAPRKRDERIKDSATRMVNL